MGNTAKKREIIVLQRICVLYESGENNYIHGRSPMKFYIS